MLKTLKGSLAVLLALSFILQAAAPAIALAALPVAPGYQACPGGYQVPKTSSCDSSDFIFFGCMILTVAAATVAFLVASFGGLFPPWGFAAMAAVFFFGATNCPHSPPPPPPPYPNLTSPSVTFASGSPIQGANINFKGTIKNSGTNSTGISFANRFDYRWGTSGAWTPFDTVSASTLAAGVSVTVVSKAFTLSNVGTLQARVCADSANAIYEPNEGDNCTSAVSFTVNPATPNLVPQAITRSGSLVVGQTQTFSSHVKNVGTGISLVSSARYCVDNSQCFNPASSAGSLGTLSVPALLAGVLSSPFSDTWVATAGAHTVYFCVVGKSCSSTGSFTVALTPPGSCTVNGHTVLNGQTITLYSRDVVAYGLLCSTYQKTARCNNGTLSQPIDSTYTHNSCSVGPAPTQTQPTLTPSSDSVRQGNTITLTYNAGNAEDCTLTGTNSYSKTGFKGAGTTAPIVINQKTVFTLRCTLSTQAKEATATVNILPVTQEI
jgi:hypothetical protein